MNKSKLEDEWNLEFLGRKLDSFAWNLIMPVWNLDLPAWYLEDKWDLLDLAWNFELPDWDIKLDEWEENIKSIESLIHVGNSKKNE